MVKLSIAAFFTKRERSSKVSSTSLWRPVHRLFIHAFVLENGSCLLQRRLLFCIMNISVSKYREWPYGLMRPVGAESL